MSICKKLNEELKKAMKDKDEGVKSYIRAIKSKTSEFCVSKGIDRDKEIPDNVMIEVITAYKKSLEKGVSQLEKGGDKAAELIREYKSEIEFCGKYLPSEENQEAHVVELVDRAISELGASDPKRAGQVIGHIMKNNKGLSGSMVKRIVIMKLGS